MTRNQGRQRRRTVLSQHHGRPLLQDSQIESPRHRQPHSRNAQVPRPSQKGHRRRRLPSPIRQGCPQRTPQRVHPQEREEDPLHPGPRLNQKSPHQRLISLQTKPFPVSTSSTSLSSHPLITPSSPSLDLELVFWSFQPDHPSASILNLFHHPNMSLTIASTSSTSISSSELEAGALQIIAGVVNTPPSSTGSAPFRPESDSHREVWSGQWTQSLRKVFKSKVRSQPWIRAERQHLDRSVET